MYSALAILVSGIIMACALIFQMRAGSVPRIHDITTDTILPPGFKAVLPLRTDASNPLIYGGSFIAEQQKKAYPDIKPLDLPIPFGAAYEMALLIAKDRGWQIVGTDPANGSIEAVDTTFWFGFKDDISIRITPLGTDARVDVRSVSRVGLSDIGTNAKRIRAFLSQLKTFAEKHPLKKT